MCFGGDYPRQLHPQMERVIATARAESRPAYILVASDYAVTPVTPSDAQPYPKPASGPDLAGQLPQLPSESRRCSVAVLPAYTVSRFRLETRSAALIEKLGCPFATMVMDKGVLPESHPQFAGMYSGAMSSPEVLKAVEGADLVIDAGGVCFHDINTTAYSSRISPDRFLTIGLDYVRVGEQIFNPVRMGDVLGGVAKAVGKNFGYKAPRRAAHAKPSGDRATPLRASAMYERYGDFLRPGDQIVIETGSSTSGIAPLTLPDGAAGSQPDALGFDWLGHGRCFGDCDG